MSNEGALVSELNQPAINTNPKLWSELEEAFCDDNTVRCET